MLDLFFGSFATACEQSFDLSRCVVDGRDLRVGQCQQDSSTCVSHQDGGFRVLHVREYFFDGSDFRPQFLNDFLQSMGKFLNPMLQCCALS